MTERYLIELEPEVRQWLESLTMSEYRRVEELADLLAEHATTLDEPYTKALGDDVRELRLRLHPLSMRITYWLAPGRRVVLLTVFAKTRDREHRQVERAKVARKICADHHLAACEEFARE
ncbi:type II toxin-antitoxin system RelE/ParE family toxin [Streptodolium elevatio]